jgi:hypothetical protein
LALAALFEEQNMFLHGGLLLVCERGTAMKINLIDEASFEKIKILYLDI